MAKSTVITSRRGLDVNTQQGLRDSKAQSNRTSGRQSSSTRTASETNDATSKREGAQLAIGTQLATGFDETTETTAAHEVQRLTSGGGEVQRGSDDRGGHVRFKIKFKLGWGASQSV